MSAKPAVQPEPQRCSSCKFYVREQCRRYPPVVFGYAKNAQKWPDVEDNDWCGEWSQRS